MIVLDTNIISEIERRESDQDVKGWFMRQQLDDLFLCAPVVAELSFGAERFMRRNKNAKHLASLSLLVKSTFSGRILDYDTRAAMENGVVRDKREAAARPILLLDSQIAAICLVHGATLATRNIRDFDGLGIKLVNPFEG